MPKIERRKCYVQESFKVLSAYSQHIVSFFPIWGLAYDHPVSIKTPRCSNVPDTWYLDEMSESEIAYRNWWVEYYYPNAIRLDDASRQYNCHGYAWHVSEGGSKVWIGYSTATAEDVYWQDGSYFQSCNFTLIASTSSTSYQDWEVIISSENEADDRYYYKVTAVNATGESCEASNIVSTWGESFQKWVDDHEFVSDITPLPIEFQLFSNHPNPFNPETEIRYALPQSGRVELVILNISGQVVRTLTAAEQAPGIYRRVWNGRDNAGNTVASGIYLCRLQVIPGDGSQSFVAVRKMLLAR